MTWPPTVSTTDAMITADDYLIQSVDQWEKCQMNFDHTLKNETFCLFV